MVTRIKLFLFFLILLPTILCPQQRGMRPLAVRDATGREVAIYSGSYALVVGMSNYTQGWPSLAGVRKDVEAVRSTLESQGFQVETKLDLDKPLLDKAISDFIARYGMKPDNRLLFYLAGHGHTIKTSYGEELGYFVPIDAPNPNRDPARFQSNSMEMAQVEIYAKRIQSKHSLFVFDACFSGSLFALSRAIPEIISYKTSEPVRQFITSGSANETVPDASIFRSQFERGLTGEADSDGDGYVTGTELGEFLQKSVVNYSRNAQHPQYGKIRNPNLDKGDFVFFLRPVTESNPVPPKMPPKTDFSLEKEKKEAEAEHVAREAWDKNLTEMKSKYDEIVILEKTAIAPQRKADVWKRFLKAFSEDDPYSVEDDAMRGKAQTQVAYWGRVKEAAPPTVTKSTSTDLPSISNSIGMQFVLVQPGTFRMGSDDGEADEKPVHEVTISKPLYIGKYEVTQAQWQTVMGNNPSRFKGDNRPVEVVSWDDAQEFIRRLNQKESTNKYRLPTEAEWEFAARGGTQSRGFRFAGSSNVADVAVYSVEETSPVGSKAPNELGIFDMSGNVWEWCSDWYGSYVGGQVTDPTGSSSGNSRILRGGSWIFNEVSCRSANRYRNGPDVRYYRLRVPSRPGL